MKWVPYEHPDLGAQSDAICGFLEMQSLRYDVLRHETRHRITVKTRKGAAGLKMAWFDVDPHAISVRIREGKYVHTWEVGSPTEQNISQAVTAVWRFMRLGVRP